MALGEDEFVRLCHSVCLRPLTQSHCLQVTCVTLLSAKTAMSFLPPNCCFPQLKPHTAGCSQRCVPWERDAKGRDQTEDTHTEEEEEKEEKADTKKVPESQDGLAQWKTAFFHMLLLSEVSRRKAWRSL